MGGHETDRPRGVEGGARTHPDAATGASSSRQVSLERVIAAEQSVAGIRLLNIAAGTIIYPLWLQGPGTVPWLAYVLLLLAWIYGLYVALARPYLRYPFLLSSYFATLIDGAFILLWIYATGGLRSPFHILLYLAVVAVALRYPARDTVFATACFIGSYLALIAGLDQVRGNEGEIVTRMVYLCMAGVLGVLVSRQLISHTRGHVAREEQSRAAASLYLASIVESSEDAIVAVDLEDGLITAWNPASERMYGYTAEEMIGKQRLPIFVPEDRLAELGELIAIVRRGERVSGFETERIAKGGRRFDVSLTVSPVLDGGGKVVGGMAVSRDITERKLAQEALRKKHVELERSNAELEQFAYVASHDLQEPLRMVACYAELLAMRYQGRLDERADKYIRYAVDGATRMQQLINDLLAYSRVGDGDRPRELVDLADVVDDVVCDLDVAIGDSDGQVTRDRLPSVYGRRTLLYQLFQSLVGNALKFRGEEPPRIHIAAERQEHAWVLSVTDNGIGIDPDFAERVFRVFQRLHERGRYSGSGIGLAIAKKIVEWHGGRIWVEPGLGKGVCFCFTVPAKDDPAG